MIQPPSLQREYSEFWSGDPAIIQAPEPPPDEADEDTKKAHKTALEDYVRMLERARDAGQWEPIIIPGERPTMFTLRPIPGKAMRALVSKMERGELDFATGAPLAFRAAIVKIENPAVEVKRVSVKSPDFEEYGPIATVDVTNYLDGIDMSIVTEIGMRALSRGTTGLPPKS